MARIAAGPARRHVAPQEVRRRRRKESARPRSPAPPAAPRPGGGGGGARARARRPPPRRPSSGSPILCPGPAFAQRARDDLKLVACNSEQISTTKGPATRTTRPRSGARDDGLAAFPLFCATEAPCTRARTRTPPQTTAHTHTSDPCCQLDSFPPLSVARPPSTSREKRTRPVSVFAPPFRSQACPASRPPSSSPSRRSAPSCRWSSAVSSEHFFILRRARATGRLAPCARARPLFPPPSFFLSEPAAWLDLTPSPPPRSPRIKKPRTHAQTQT